ncbi:hypothetical protein LXA43DRAFT_1089086 [Ganoderma leucocontextum]|nr:hypothetical protein LXA43DRAFT_1089086 [Ganoderma leucocontextum]
MALADPHRHGSVLPKAPPYPCPFLTDEEIQTYLTPLYAWAWTVQPSNPGDKNKTAPELVKTFAFSTTQELVEFLQRVGDITRSENHHAVLEESADFPSIAIRVHTHSGLRPASHPGERRKERVQPGITLRDVRFAHLVEMTLGDDAPAHWHHGEMTLADIAAQPRSAEGVEARRYAAGHRGA